MRKRPGLEFHRLDAHQTRKQHGEERKKTIIPPLPSPHLSLNFTVTAATSPNFPPNMSNIDPSERTEPEKHQNTTMERVKNRLTLDFVGVGLLAPRHRGEDDDDGGGGGGDDDDDDERRRWWMIKGMKRVTK